MTRKLEDILEQKKKIIVNHGLLKEVDVVPLNETAYSFKDISQFIESCWRESYSGEARVIFSPDYLEYILKDIKDDQMSLIARTNEKIVGILLFVKNQFLQDNTLLKSGTVTGLTTDPKYRGAGISQLLTLNVEELLIKYDYHFATFWLDDRHGYAGSSYQIYGKDLKKTEIASNVTLYGKSFDYAKTLETAKISFMEKVGIKSMMKIFPLQSLLPNGLTVKEYSAEYVHECLKFINSYQRMKQIRRQIEEQELHHLLGFTRGTRLPISFMIFKNNVLCGLLYGVRNPVNSKNYYFQIDGMLFHPNLSYHDKRKIIGSCEHKVLNDFSCFSAIVPETVIAENVIKFGYVPIMKQTIGANVYNDEILIDKKNIKKLYLELR